jgi:hypothetical protein
MARYDRFAKRPRGEYHLDFILSVITARNECGVADDSLHPNYWAAGEIGDADRDGVYLTVELFEHRDLYKAIGSDVDLMRFTGLQ